MYKKILYWLGVVLSLVAFYWFIQQLNSHGHVFSQLEGIHIFPVLICIGLYVFSIFLSAIVWWLLVRTIAPKAFGWNAAARIMFISQLAKYLPGNFAHHLGRILLTKNAGLNTGVILYSLFLELMIVLMVSSLLAFTALVMLGQESLVFGEYRIDSFLLWSPLLLLLAVYLLQDGLLNRALRWWSGKKRVSLAEIKIPTPRQLAPSLVLCTVNFLLLGVVLKILMLFIFSPGMDISFFILACAFSLAWVVGFITPGSPAGLGVRELILVATLTQLMQSQEAALAITALLRAVTVLGDGLAFMVGMQMNRNRP